MTLKCHFTKLLHVLQGVLPKYAIKIAFRSHLFHASCPQGVVKIMNSVYDDNDCNYVMYVFSSQLQNEAKMAAEV